MNGYWVFHAPVGYKFENKPMHGKILVPDEPVASIVKEALEGFASGRFATQGEFKKLLGKQTSLSEQKQKRRSSFQNRERYAETSTICGVSRCAELGHQNAPRQA